MHACVRSFQRNDSVELNRECNSYAGVLHLFVQSCTAAWFHSVMPCFSTRCRRWQQAIEEAFRWCRSPVQPGTGCVVAWQAQRRLGTSVVATADAWQTWGLQLGIEHLVGSCSCLAEPLPCCTADCSKGPVVGRNLDDLLSSTSVVCLLSARLICIASILKNRHSWSFASASF